MRPIDADFAKVRIRNSGLTNREKIALLLVLEDVPTITPPPNDPLTLEQLREMDGNPIWITGERFHPRWDLIRRVTISGMATYTLGFLAWEDCGKTWLAYRRNP